MLTLEVVRLTHLKVGYSVELELGCSHSFHLQHERHNRVLVGIVLLGVQLNSGWHLTLPEPCERDPMLPSSLDHT